jgi:hypothetical protein
MIRRVTVCGLVNPLSGGAIGKPSLNRASTIRKNGRSLAVDANLRELPMSRLNRGLYRVEDRTHLG